MRKVFIISIFLLMLSAVEAQQRNCNAGPERFQMELEQYITRKAGLTPKESSTFFPLYSEMLRKQRAVHEKMKNLKRVKPKSDADCKKSVQQCDKLEIEMKQIQKTYHDKFLKVLPASKVFDILKAEEKFHRQAFKKAADKKRKK